MTRIETTCIDMKEYRAGKDSVHLHIELDPVEGYRDLKICANTKNI